MKVVSSKTMAHLESLAYASGCSEEQFMESAGKEIACRTEQFIAERNLPKQVALLCGKGNNGGDAFVAGLYLLKKGYHVFAYHLPFIEVCSPLCSASRKRFQEAGGLIRDDYAFNFSSCSVILDGLFGTGFKGEIEQPYASLIDAANQSQKPILAIDIPSGLDGTTGEIKGSVIQATETLFLGLPKTGFFLQDGWNYVGILKPLDFGLPSQFIDGVTPDLTLLTHELVSPLLPKIKRNRHKYETGYVIGLAGSPSMPGAALLSSLSALRGGCGIVRLLYPKGMEAELANSPYELIKVPYEQKDDKTIVNWMEKGTAIFAGPGLGRDPDKGLLLQAVIPFLTRPCVLDADALYFITEKNLKIPPRAILTPHHGEMARLLHYSAPLSLTSDLLQTCQKYAEEKQITLILKGAPTFIFNPRTPIQVSSTGDPGMATAGSGDVLTGLLAALLSQGLSSADAASLGVYMHGLAGEYAARERGSFGMIASDIIKHIARVWMHLTR